jgi:hypothetical protein
LVFTFSQLPDTSGTLNRDFNLKERPYRLRKTRV